MQTRTATTAIHVAVCLTLCASGCRTDAREHDVETITNLSTDQLRPLVGKRVQVEGKATGSLNTAYVVCGAFTLRIEPEPDWEWPSELEGSRVNVTGELCWQEPYVMPELPPGVSERDLSMDGTRRPGRTVPGHCYLRGTEYVVLERSDSASSGDAQDDEDDEAPNE